MARTTQQQLDAIDATIERVEQYGQATGADGQNLTRANIAALYAERQRLEMKLARESTGGRRIVVRFPEVD